MVGDVTWAKFPFSDLSDWKFRPVAVIADAREMGEDDWLMCEITTSTIPYARAIAIGQDDMQLGRLRRESRVRPDRIVTLNESTFGRPIGWLTAAKQAEIATAIRGLF